MKALSKIAVLIITLLWQVTATGQTEAVVRLDTNVILIGDQATLELSFKCPANYEVIWPSVTDTLIKEIEVLKHSELISEITKDQYDNIYRQSFTITGFDSGYFAIPPFRIRYLIPGDTSLHFTESEVTLLEVKSIPINLEEEIKDIKDPMHAPFTFTEAIPYILVFLGAVIVGFLIYYYIKKRKKSEPVFKVALAHKIPAHQMAIEALESLRFKKLWQNGEIKQYHSELTDIVREYLWAKFNIHALEYTTEEIMSAVNNTQTNLQAKEKLHQTLVRADMVKFAKMQPLPLEHDASLNNAIDFVKETTHLNNASNDSESNSDAKPKAIESEVLASDETSQGLLNTADRKEVKDV